MDFRAALTRAYFANPCQVLPNPLWKTLADLDNCRAAFILGPGDLPTHLEICQGDRLLLYWDADRARLAVPSARIARLSFALLHQDYLPALPPQLYHHRTAYFRLIAQPGSLDVPVLPDGFTFRDVQVDHEAQQVSALIQGCYTDLSPTIQTVRSWTRRAVFAPALWVWVWDGARDQPAALGIAELDRSIGEGALEWVQVLPEYRGCGLGTALVRELLRRMQGQAGFVTVSGEVANPTAPERLYRRCGFTGQDVWWVLRS